MPYKPISRPQRIESQAVDRGTGDQVGLRTIGGSPAKAKLVARAFARGPQPRDQAPAWGPSSRSFSEQRELNPNSFGSWGEKLATTNVGLDFMAPPPEPPSTAARPLNEDREVV